ncbi:RidA family protein [Massilia cavernae]|uniref:RidA family protein n=1 Tax=Massilia cavernae TaxID=2320864 RepID=A0A418XGU7_9BURK|nr:RidA family protein [Massilia cavernae]RJG11671.1 RidA family protein [Massilia cavernae]
MPHAPAPAGHYSQATLAAGLVFVSGQLPLRPPSMEIPEGIEAQLIQAMKNVEHILLAAGSSLAKLVSVQLFIADVSLWPEVNRVYAQIMRSSKPARTIVPVGALHYGALIEINAIAEVADHLD